MNIASSHTLEDSNQNDRDVSEKTLPKQKKFSKKGFVQSASQVIFRDEIKSNN